MKSFSVTVDSMTKKEYLQAAHTYAGRIYSLLAFFIIAICGTILIFMESVTFKAVISPIIFYFIIIVFCELRFHMEYKKGVKDFPKVTYEFDSKSWSVNPGSEAIHFEWKQTPKLKESRDCIFLYNDDISSNMIPKRLLTKAELTSLTNWFNGSRNSYKAYEKQIRAKHKAAVMERKRNNPFSMQFRRRY